MKLCLVLLLCSSLYIEQGHVLEFHVVFWGYKLAPFSITLRLHLQTNMFYSKDERSMFFRNVGKFLLCVILGFRRDVDEICALLVHYAASSDSSVPTFRDNL
jgi:hypothetical protein